MKRLGLIAAAVLVIAVAAVYGFAVARYQLFPFDALRAAESRIESVLGRDSSPTQAEHADRHRPAIGIADAAGVVQTRDRLVDHIWGEEGFPVDALPSSVETDISDQRYEGLAGLERIDRLTTTMEHGVDSIAYLFHPAEANGELMVYHQGHRGDFHEGKATIASFLDRGYTVLALSMPLLGMNSQPSVVLPDFGAVDLIEHDYLRLLETDEFSPIKYYLEPVARAVNYAAQELDLARYHMIGISGGGWTTGLYAAVDPRISHSFAVAGSVPLYLHTVYGDAGDYEQMGPALYRAANYLEQYVLASTGEGREFVQIFNRYDPCCMSGDVALTYLEDIQSTVSALGPGSFDIVIDDSHREHAISDRALQVVAERLAD